MDFGVLAGRFDDTIGRAVLYHTGFQAARDLYKHDLKEILRPRSFSGSGAPLSPSGKRMVSFSIATNKKSVIVRSFPMNVYREPGEKGPRTMKRTAGKKIFRSFEGNFDAEFWAQDVLADILQGAITEEAPNTKQGWKMSWQTKLKTLKKSPGTGGKML
jgi:hypothetical protein